MSDQFNSDDDARNDDASREDDRLNDGTVPNDGVEPETSGEAVDASASSSEDVEETETTDSKSGKHAAPAGDTPWWKRPPFIIGAVAVVIIIVLLLTLTGKDDKPSSSLEGAQENIPAPAQGTRDSVQSMEVVIDGKSAPVDLVQLTDQGSLIPPTDVSRLGWYAASAIPGAEGPSGSSVITGHVNAADQGEGYAARFADLKVGDTVTVKVNGEDRDFKVSKDPIHVVKGAEMPESVNDVQGENRLVLITCGGEYVGGSLGYSDNIIVEAAPVR